MVKMQPEINFIKAKCYGNSEKISEEQYELYKKEHYQPLADLIPLILQLILLMALLIGLSLYLGFFVKTGVGIYWTFSNLLSIAQLYLLNIIMNSKKYIDYDALEKSRKELAESSAFHKSSPRKFFEKDPYRKEKNLIINDFSKIMKCSSFFILKKWILLILSEYH